MLISSDALCACLGGERAEYFVGGALAGADCSVHMCFADVGGLGAGPVKGTDRPRELWVTDAQHTSYRPRVEIVIYRAVDISNEVVVFVDGCESDVEVHDVTHDRGDDSAERQARTKQVVNVASLAAAERIRELTADLESTPKDGDPDVELTMRGAG